MTAKTVTINVTQAHIDAGAKKNCNACPFALALIDAGYSEPDVRWVVSSVLEDGEKMNFATPYPLFRFIEDFDSGNDVEPFKIGIRLVTPE